MSSPQNKSGQSQQPTIWIDAYKSVTNQLDTYPNNIELADIDGTGENKIVVGEFTGQLSVYKGTTIEWQTQLPEEISVVGQFLMSSGKNSKRKSDSRTDAGGLRGEREVRLHVPPEEEVLQAHAQHLSTG